MAASSSLLGLPNWGGGVLFLVAMNALDGREEKSKWKRRKKRPRLTVIWSEEAPFSRGEFPLLGEQKKQDRQQGLGPGSVSRLGGP